jgi:hypothetical protein
MLRVRGAIQKPLSNLIGTYLQHYTVRPLHEQVGGDCSQIRIRPARSFNLCNDNGLIVIIGPFSNYFAQLLAIGAEEPKTCGRISEACSFLSCHRHYFDEAYNKYRRNCDCRQQCERASHGTTDPAPHDQMRLPMQLPWAIRAPSIFLITQQGPPRCGRTNLAISAVFQRDGHDTQSHPIPEGSF